MIVEMRTYKRNVDDLPDLSASMKHTIFCGRGPVHMGRSFSSSSQELRTQINEVRRLDIERTASAAVPGS